MKVNHKGKDAMKIITFAVALAVLSPSAFAGDHKAQIQGYADAWMAAYNNHDVASLAKMYTDDAEMSWPTGSESGKAAILEAFKKDFATNAMKFNSILTDTAERIGDISISHGTWTATALGPDGNEQPVNGHWLIVGKCHGEDCLISYDFVNMPVPQQ
jgi:ketosteroid isomerase-like protein